MAAPAPWESDPTVDAAPAPVAPAAPAPAAPQAQPDAPWSADPAAAADTPKPAAAAAPPASPAPEGFSNEERQQILAYVPKAKDANDLEQYSLQLTNGRAKIGNPQEVIDKRDKGATQFGWDKPTVDPAMAAPQKGGIKDAIGNAILDSLDTFMPGLGMFLKAHRDEGRAYTANAADAAGGDYGPEIAGLLDTAGDPSQWGDFGANLDRNAAHEHAMLSGESDGHPIASAAGQLTGAALTAPVAGEALDAAGIAADGSKIASGVRAATGGAVYGSGAAGPGDRAAGAVTGGALGAATDVAAPYVPTIIKALKPVAKTLDPDAEAAARAAADLGVTLPDFTLTDQGRAAAAAAEPKAMGFPIRQAANEMVDTSKAARDAIVSGVGTPAVNDTAMADSAQAAAVGGVKANRKAIGAVYDQAKVAAGNIAVPATETAKTIQGLIDEENQGLAGTKVASTLQGVLDNLNTKGGAVTIDGARATRTNLRSNLVNDAGVTPSNADRITNQVMGALGADINNGLDAAGRKNAIPLYQEADKRWAQQLSTEDDVLKPILGKDMNDWGEDVAKRLGSDIKGKGTRLAQFLSALPNDEANNVRATLIQHLGAATDGQQNAAGDRFSLNTFLTNWNNIKGARNLVFDKDTRDSLNKLAQIAQVAKESEKLANKSNTGRVVASILSAGKLAEGGGIASLAMHDWKPLIVGSLATAFSSIRQYQAAKMLASPSIVKKIAATPLNPKAAQAFWSRPWVKGLQLQNPAISAEIQTFQQSLLKAINDNVPIPGTTAASPQKQQSNQAQQ